MAHKASFLKSSLFFLNFGLPVHVIITEPDQFDAEIDFNVIHTIPTDGRRVGLDLPEPRVLDLRGGVEGRTNDGLAPVLQLHTPARRVILPHRAPGNAWQKKSMSEEQHTCVCCVVFFGILMVLRNLLKYLR